MSAHVTAAPRRPAHDPNQDFAVAVKLWIPREDYKRLRGQAERVGITVAELITAHLPAQSPEPLPAPGTGKLTAGQLAAIRHALSRGASPAELAPIWGISIRTIQRIAKTQIERQPK